MADTLDVLTLAEGTAALSANRTNTQQINTDELAAWITGVSRFLDRVCGPIVKRDIAAERQNGGSNTVMLYQRPVDSVTTCTEYWFATPHVLTEEVPGTQESFQFLLDARKGVLYRRMNGWDYPFWPGRLNVVTTYVAGRFDDTASVDEQFKAAARLTLANAWRRERGLTGQAAPLGATFMLPNAAKEILRGELLNSIVGVA